MDKRTKRLFWAVLIANVATILLKSVFTYLLNLIFSHPSFDASQMGGGDENGGMMAMHFDIEGNEGSEVDE